MKRLTLDERTAKKIKTVKGWKNMPDMGIARKLGITIEAVQYGKKQISN